MNLSSAFELFKVDREVYCTPKTMIFYNENVPKLISYLSDRQQHQPDKIDTDTITRDLAIATQL